MMIVLLLLLLLLLLVTHLINLLRSQVHRARSVMKVKRYLPWHATCSRVMLSS